MKDDLKPIKFPANFEHTVAEWLNSGRPGVGACLLCGGTIASEADFIPGTNSHDCPEGRAFEAATSLKDAETEMKPMNRDQQDALAWRIIHEQEQVPVVAATRRRPKDYRELEIWLRDGVNFEHVWSEFLHGFFAARDEAFFAYPSPPSLSPGWQALLAGAAEWLSSEFGLPHPVWTDHPRYFLDQPWDPGEDLGLDMSESIDDTLARSPEAFQKRNVAYRSRNLITL